MSPPAALVVLAPGLATTLQDLGRPGWRALGIPPGGALDPVALRLVNALLGNPPGCAALEILLAGPTLRVEGRAVRIAALGPVRLRATGPDGETRSLAVGRTHTLAAGSHLSLGAVEGQRGAILGVAGGVALPGVLGSLSTHPGAGLGPFGGRALAEGDRLPLGATPPAGPERAFPLGPDPLLDTLGPIRVVLGPQDDAFTAEAIATLLSAPFRISGRSDRMGLRLEGPALAHRAGADIASDGVVAGCLQVPGSGQPIMLLADHQTTGGYAKIATAISADLPRLSRLPPGAELRFVAIDPTEAEDLKRAQERAIAARIASIIRVGDGLADPGGLWRENLVSGVVDASADPFA